MGLHTRTTFRKSLSIGTVAVLAAGVFSTSPLVAGASGGEISFYLSAPYVQGSHVSGAGVFQESFNSVSLGSKTSQTIAMGTMSTASSHFNVEDAGWYGGASVNPLDATPTQATGTSENGTRYVSNNGQEVSITLTAPAKYVGLWWSAGITDTSCNNCNTIKLFSGATEVASMNEAQVATVLSATSVSRVDGGTHASADYQGNPSYGTPPAATENQNFAYLNLFVTGGRSVDRIVLSGDGFEFDNLVTAASEFSPTGSMVFVASQQGSWPTDQLPASDRMFVLPCQSSSLNGNLYEIDTESWEATLVGESGSNAGLGCAGPGAYNPSDGFGYWISYDTANSARLVKVNLQTGASSPIATFPSSAVIDGASSNVDVVSSLAIGSQGRAWATAYDSGGDLHLFSLNLATASYTHIGEMKSNDPDYQFFFLAWDPLTDNLYGHNYESLYLVNTQTGSISAGPTSFFEAGETFFAESVSDIAFDSTGQLWGTDSYIYGPFAGNATPAYVPAGLITSQTIIIAPPFIAQTPPDSPTNRSKSGPSGVSVIDVNPTNITVDKEIITVFGSNLNTVTDVFIGGVRVTIFTQSGNRLQVRAPRGLSGLVDLELKSSLNDVLLIKKLNFGSTTVGTGKATLIVGGFDHNSRKLTKRMKNRIDRWLTRNSDLGTLTCTGFTSLPRRTTDVTLSTNRGKTACNFSKRQRSDLETSVSQGIEDPRPGSNVRRVRLVLTP